MNSKFIFLLGSSLLLSACSASTSLTLPTSAPTAGSDSQLTEPTKVQIQSQTDEQLLKSLESDSDLNFDADLKALETDLK